MNFSWATPKQEVIDSVRRWGFTYNSEKMRWDKGMLNGYKCNKLKLWFDSDSTLEGVEAKYQYLDTATSRQIFERYRSQTQAAHGAADVMIAVDGAVSMRRASWDFSDKQDAEHDMIVIDGFEAYVLFHAARNMPPLFDLAPMNEE